MDALQLISLKVPVSYQAGEELAVGLIMIHQGKIYYRESAFKLSIAKKLIPDPSYVLLIDKLKMIRSEFARVNKNSEIRFDTSHTLLSKEHLSYLSKYSNNALRFDFEEVDLPYEDGVFELLFSRFVSDRDEKTSKKKSVSIKKWLRSELKPQIDQRVSWDVILDSHHYENLIFPEIKFDFAGKNGKLVVGQALDFHKNYKTIRGDLATLYTFSQTKDIVNKTFVIGREPDKKNELVHDLWSQFRREKSITVINGEDELEQIPEYLDKKGIQPLKTAG